MTTVPLSSELSCRLPPSWRSRSRIPLIPTPNLPPVNRELAILKRAFRLGKECTPPKVHNVPYFRTLKENNVRKGFLEPTQYEAVSRECAKYGSWMRTLFELAYTYGWRHAELLSLKVSQVSIVDRTIRLNPGETKNDEGREVTMTPLLRHLLQQCVRGKKPAYFVLNAQERQSRGRLPWIMGNRK